MLTTLIVIKMNMLPFLLFCLLLLLCRFLISRSWNYSTLLMIILTLVLITPLSTIMVIVNFVGSRILLNSSIVTTIFLIAIALTIIIMFWFKAHITNKFRSYILKLYILMVSTFIITLRYIMLLITTRCTTSRNIS
jgi:hypothetical protein